MVCKLLFLVTVGTLVGRPAEGTGLLILNTAAVAVLGVENEDEAAAATES